MAKPVTKTTPQWKEDLIITYFRTNKNNGTKHIANFFQLPINTVNNVLNRHFKMTEVIRKFKT